MAEAVGPAADPGDELVDWVDADGTVLGVVTRRRMRAENLRHRATYVVVVNSADELIVHRRARWKDVNPGFWDVCFGGVVDAGEGWEEAAARELAEEAGISGVPLVALGPLTYDAPDGHIVGRAYLVRTDAEPTCPDGEVELVDRVPLAVLDNWLEGRQVCRDSVEEVLPILRPVLNHR